MTSKHPEAARKTTRVIKKYPNRRLYDTDASAYITLSEVRQLVMEGHSFVVSEDGRRPDAQHIDADHP